jgi:hypothetical protein
MGKDSFPLSRPGAYPLFGEREWSSICLSALFRVPLTFSFVQLSSFPGAQVVVLRCSFRCCLASMTTSPLHSPLYVTVINRQISVMFFFVVYFTMLSISLTLPSNGKMTIESERIRKEAVVTYPKCCPDIILRLRKTTKNCQDGLADIPAEIRSEHFPETSLESYRYTGLSVCIRNVGGQYLHSLSRQISV